MDIIEGIKNRRSVRAWTEQNVSDDVLNQILEAGRWTPSPLNSQPWHFIVIKNRETIKNLTSHANHAGFLIYANVLIVVTSNKTGTADAWLEEHDQHIYSAACAIENMWLAAWDLQIGGVWVTVDDQFTRQILNIPEDQVIIGSLAIGYPKGNPVPHRDMDRKSLSEIVFKERFGDK